MAANEVKPGHRKPKTEETCMLLVFVTVTLCF